MAEPNLIANHGSQSALIDAACRSTAKILATGTGDYTQPDTIQAFDDVSGAPIPSSNELNFPGPVLVLHEFIDVYPSVNRKTVTAIVRDLRTGNYEAYHLSATCGQ